MDSTVINKSTQPPANQNTNAISSQATQNIEPVAARDQTLSKITTFNDESQPDTRDVNRNHEIASQASNFNIDATTTSSNE